MVDIPKPLLLVAAAPFLAFAPISAASAHRPSLTIFCSTATGGVPVQCRSAMRDSVLEVDLDNAPAVPHSLVFREVDAVTQPRIVSVPLGAPTAQIVRLTLPAQLCAFPDIVRWKVLLGNGALPRTSVGAVTVRC
jgi:hypothetical protein